MVNNKVKKCFYAGLAFLALILLSGLGSASFPEYSSKSAHAATFYYDFVANAASASWSSGAGALPFPGSNADSRGFALYVNKALLEDGLTYPTVLETHPQWVSSGYIVGNYPQMAIPADAQIRLKVGFLNGASGTDGVTYEVRFLDNKQNLYTFYSILATYDQKLDGATIDLSNYASLSGFFILYVNAGKSSGQDWACWVEATLEPKPLPDLTITDIFYLNNAIYYKIKNVGDAAVSGPTAISNSLLIDNQQVSVDTLSLSFSPGQELERSFPYKWTPTAQQHTLSTIVDTGQNVHEKDENNNRRDEALNSTPDLTPLSLKWLPKQPIVGGLTTFTVSIKNEGNWTSTTCIGTLHKGKLLLANVSIPAVKVNETVNVTLYWSPTQTGLQTITFKADYLNTVAELNELNNELSDDILILPNPSKADLVADGIFWTPETATVGNTLQLKPEISNVGNLSSTSCIIEFYVDQIKIGSTEIQSIPSGSNLWEVGEASVSWVPSSVGVHVIKLVVDSDNTVDEFDETNNVVEVPVNVTSADMVPPVVKVTHTPSNPTEMDAVTFQANATDSGGIASLTIYVNGVAVKTVYNATTCSYTGGPYQRGRVVNYAAQAFDKVGNPALTRWYNFTVANSKPGTLTVNLVITPSEPTELDEVEFTINATHPYGVSKIRLYLNGHKAAEETNGTILVATRGPWAPGTTVQYYADAYDIDGNYVKTAEGSFTVQELGRYNTKRMSSYMDREVFMISDLDWRAVLQLVPISIWKEMHPTEPVAVGSTYSFPVLIYHEESDEQFDADSSILFLQQYAAYGRNRLGMRVTLIGEPPPDLLRLLVASPPLGAGLDEGQIRVWRSNATSTLPTLIDLGLPGVDAEILGAAITAKWGISLTVSPSGRALAPMDDVLTEIQERQIREDYWSDINVYVLSEDEYNTGLMASVYASLLDAPLIFQGEYNISELYHRCVYLIGDFTDSEVDALRDAGVKVLQRWSLDEVRRNYVAATSTNKMILVNPLDLWINRNQTMYTDYGGTVNYVFGKHSLAAPFLAANKKEVIIGLPTHCYPEIDAYVLEQFNSLMPGPSLKYLTIIATPEAIPNARANIPYPIAISDDALYYQGQRFIDTDIVRYSITTETERYVFTLPMMQYNPVCSNKILAWVDENTWGDIWYRDLTTGANHRLTGATGSWAGQCRPTVYDTKIIWQDSRNGNQELYMYNTITSIMVQLTNSTSNDEAPALWGDTVVWQKDVGGYWSIYKMNILTRATERVSPLVYYKCEKPAICQDKVVYCSLREDQWDIYMVDLDTMAETRITTDPGMQWLPKIYGDNVVWQDNRNGNWDIYVYNIASSTETRLTSESTDQMYPNIWGDRVVWQERGNDGFWYIVLHDISEGTTTRVARTEVSADDGPLWLELDGRYYGSTQNMGYQDIATGRIYGVTVADASAYIARDLFYERITRSRDALVVVREDHQDEIENPIDSGDLEAYARATYWTASVEDHFRNTYFYAGYSGVDPHSTEIGDKYDEVGLIVFVDHGIMDAFASTMSSTTLINERRKLQPVTVLDLACLTGAYYVLVTTGDPVNTFSAQNIRRGAMVYMGATDVSYWHNMFDNLLTGLYEDRRTIGEVYLEARNEEYDIGHWVSTNLRGDIYYALHGDPTFTPKWLSWETEETWWP